MTVDRRPALSREHHLRIFSEKYPFAELATLGFRRCSLSQDFTTRRGIIPIRVVTLTHDQGDRAVTVDVDEHGNARGHFTVIIGDNQPALIAETASAALQLVLQRTRDIYLAAVAYRRCKLGPTDLGNR